MMDCDISQYLSLLRRFLASEVLAQEFQAAYLEMFKREERQLDPPLFSILDTLFGDVDSFVLDPELRAELQSQTPDFYLDEMTLRHKVSIAYKKLTEPSCSEPVAELINHVSKAMSPDKSGTVHRDPATETSWRLLAIGLDPDKATPDLYGLIYEAEKDVPLMVDGRIVFFTDPGRALELVQQYGAPLVADKTDVAKPSFWCDVAQALHFLSSGGTDTDASVLRAVNVLLDLVRASGADLEDRRRRALYSIADYCTFSKDLTKYLEEEGDYSSAELVEAVLWCVGAVVVKARIV